MIARHTPTVRYIVYDPITKLHGVTTDKYLTTMEGPDVLFYYEPMVRFMLTSQLFILFDSKKVQRP